jgi:hypothetical protein
VKEAGKTANLRRCDDEQQKHRGKRGWESNTRVAGISERADRLARSRDLTLHSDLGPTMPDMSGGEVVT